LKEKMISISYLYLTFSWDRNQSTAFSKYDIEIVPYLSGRSLNPQYAKAKVAKPLDARRAALSSRIPPGRPHKSITPIIQIGHISEEILYETKFSLFCLLFYLEELSKW
jgi:hypothetical protein